MGLLSENVVTHKNHTVIVPIADLHFLFCKDKYNYLINQTLIDIFEYYPHFYSVDIISATCF
jgi:hypothetical protein